MTRHTAKTRQMLIETAFILFTENGYENTSIQSIIEKTGVSKGAFYHYFDSKESILEEIVLLQSRAMLAEILKITDDPKKNALEKLSDIMNSSIEYNSNPHEIGILILKILKSYENIHFWQKLIDKTVVLIKPVLSRIFTQGKNEGLFNIEYPEEAAEFYLNTVIALKKSISYLLITLQKNPENMQIIRRKLQFHEIMFERILGISERTLNISQKQIQYFENVYPYLNTPEYAKLIRQNLQNISTFTKDGA